MNLVKKIFFASRLRTNIIVTFSVVSIIIVVVTARVSYLFIKELYLDQLKDQVNLYVKTVGLQIEDRYLKTLPLGVLSPGALFYFQNLFEKNSRDNSVQEVFIFDFNFKLLVHSDTGKTLNMLEPSLYLNKSEIDALDIGSSITSLPFKSKTGNWYMWGFYKLTDNHWLAVRENALRLKKVELFAMYFWYIGIGGVILTIFAGLFVAKKIVDPINQLVWFSKQIGSRNFNEIKPDKVTGELKILADAMELMKNNLMKHHKEKEEMLARIAHEIRNPLGGIELLANLTKEDLLKEKKNTNYIDGILKEISGLKELITSYLDYSKPAHANPHLCNLSSTFSEIQNIFAKNSTDKQITINCVQTSDNILFDPSHLRNILVNLVSNSLDATSYGGKITIDFISQNGHSEIIINDTGNGISKEAESKIFEPFFTTKKQGTGLGLAISKKLCEENNAELFLRESSSMGSTFIIKINS
ncbi:MAG: HAMP domain-containing histidine kinase [Bacteroidetes bacterium]|nr:HAMP domain-containing histidine kinase [Bacteroidota bacterium]